MAQYDDPLSAASAPGFSRYIDPTQAAQAGLQWTGGSTGWQPAVTPEQATAQGLQYTGGDTTPPNPVYQQYGAIVPEGGGPIMPGTPGNIAQFGAQTATGPAADALSAAFNQRGRSEQYLSAIAPIQQRQQELGSQLQNATRRQAPGLISQIRSLDQQRQAIQFAAAQDQHQLDFEANQRRVMAHQSAMESHQQLSTDRETSIDEQGHAMLQTMGKLDSALRSGKIDKSTYDDALLQAGAQYPLAMRHPEAARHFEFAITEADKQNAYNLRREATQAAKLGARYGIGVQTDPDTGLPSIEHTRQAALQTDKGRQEAITGLNREMFQKYGIPTGVGSLFNPIAPHESPDEGKTIDLPYVDKTGKVDKLNVPTPLFDQMKQDFNDRYQQLQPQRQNQPAQNQIPQITSQAEYQSLPAGSTFISGGKQYRKPAEQGQ